MSAFPNFSEQNEKNPRILFKIEKEPKKNIFYILIQSSICPDWSFLIKEDHFLSSNPQFKQFEYPKFSKEAKYWFKLFGNTTKKVKGKRVGIIKEEEQYNWLKRKSESGGFKIQHAVITKREKFLAKENKDSKSMTFYGVEFEGVIQIVDSLKFDNAIKTGIGSGKAFGFGFLTITRL